MSENLGTGGSKSALNLIAATLVSATNGNSYAPRRVSRINVLVSGTAPGYVYDSSSLVLAALSAPVQAALSTSTTGGTLAAATYFYKVTAVNGIGETIGSNEQSIITTGTTSSNTVSWSAVSGATGYRIYRGTATGAENTYYVVGAVTSFVDTGAASTAGTTPATNTANINQVFVIPNSTGTYWVDFPCLAGIVVTPGTGQTVCVSYD